MKNFYISIGCILEKEKLPCFATPIFVNDEGKIVIQEIKDNKITYKEINQELLKIPNGIKVLKVHYTENYMLNTPLYCYVFSERQNVIGTKKEVAEFIEKKFNKFKSKFKNPFTLGEIVDFVNSTKSSKDILEK